MNGVAGNAGGQTAGGGWSRLDELAGWLAAVQGAGAPRPPGRPVLIVVTGEHGIARAGVSTREPGSSALEARTLRDGSAGVAMLAAASGVGLRVVETGPASGRIDIEDALDDVATPLAAGSAVADAEIDAGADLLLLGDTGVGSSTAAAVVVAAVTGAEPVAVVGRGGGIDDAAWMRKAAAVRDALRRVHEASAQWEPLRLIGVAGGADLATLTGILLQATARRTPVLIDGTLTCTGALLAEVLAPGAARWWVAAQRGTEPAQQAALGRLGLVPLLDLGLAPGSGVGALLALAILRAAALLAPPTVRGPSSG
ncbi:MAG: nicotinate-nucleotide--dimethylbenzimidazole phosphoribosyltransferase [Mycobacteriales bacterium]